MSKNNLRKQIFPFNHYKSKNGTLKQKGIITFRQELVVFFLGAEKENTMIEIKQKLVTKKGH